jgi:hypothetical protein
MPQSSLFPIFQGAKPASKFPEFRPAPTSNLSGLSFLITPIIYSLTFTNHRIFFLQLVRQSDTITAFLNVALLNVSPARQQRVGLTLRPVRRSDSEVGSAAKKGFER